MNDRPLVQNPETARSGSSRGRKARGFDQWTVRARIASAFTVVVSLVAIQAAFSIPMLRQQKADAITLREKSVPALTTIAHLERDSSEQQIAVLRMLLSKPGDDLTPFSLVIKNGRSLIDREFRDYEENITRADDRALYSELLKRRATYRQAADAVIELVAQGKHDEGAALNVQRLRPA